MESFCLEENLVDLLGEKNMLLRQRCEQLWNTRGKIKLSSSERFLLMRIYGRQTTVAELAKGVDITRQAIHKCIKSLRAKGLLEMETRENNRRDKYVYMTALGEQCYRENMSMKQEVEETIAAAIGAENVERLRQLLQKPWLG